MSWIAVALIGYLFWSFVNIGEKYAVGSRMKNPYVYLVWITLIGGIIATSIIPFVHFFVPGRRELMIIALAAALWFFGGLPFVKALQIEDITRINVWWNLIPLFSFPLEWAVIGERIQGFQMYAFCFLLVGGILASLHFKNYRIVLSKAFPLMALATASFAGYAVALRYVTQTAPFSVVFVWTSMIAAIMATTFLISRSFRSAFLYECKGCDARLFGVTIGNALLERVGILFNAWALSLGPAALVFALEGFQTIFVFILATVITIKNPAILKEELDKKNLFLKVAALLSMLFGIVLLYR